MTQKEIKEKYMDIIRTEVFPDSPRMQKFMEQQFYYGVELADGDIYVIDKPSIKKDFCFGFGYCGADLSGDQDRADKAAQNAKENDSYFFSENLRYIDCCLEKLTSPAYEGYKYCNYSGRHQSKLKTYTMCYSWENPENEPFRWERLKDVKKLTREEIAALAEGYEKVRQMFIKRLKTYLKKYGLSKLNVWTYLRD